MLGLILATGMLGKVLIGILIAIHFLLCLFLIAVVLLQSGKAGDLSSAFGGGGGSQANVAAMSSENILTRATKITAFGFMLTSLLLALFAHGDSGTESVTDLAGDEAPLAGAVEPGADATDAAPAVTPVSPPSSSPAPAGDDPADDPADDAPPAEDDNYDEGDSPSDEDDTPTDG